LVLCLGLLGDIVRINAPSFGAGLGALVSFQIFPLITCIMALCAIAVILYSIGNFRQIMLSGDTYKELTPQSAQTQKEKQIVQILDELLHQSQTPFRPRLYLLEAPYLNAFASGWNQNNALIALTSALVGTLDRDEIKAVMAHELSHIRHGDIQLTLVVGILANIMTLALNFIIMAFFGGNRNEGAKTARSILMILSFVLPLLTVFLQMFLSRSREYMADSGAAYLMNDNRPMIAALQKISGSYEKYNFADVDTNPTRRAAYIFGFGELLSTHPSIENRIRALMHK
ncbi:MAG: zinc metalloprotease HtpX, partial [Helicobacter sp.]|nr:zinc metalloprotease HtpX [Helicobacter sp.]